MTCNFFVLFLFFTTWSEFCVCLINFRVGVRDRKNGMLVMSLVGYKVHKVSALMLGRKNHPYGHLKNQINN